jgi:Domain of unknown function (DUF4037)
VKGLLLAEAYFQDHGEPLLRKQFPQLMDRLAIGLVGSGSECFGFDDDYSRDHNWGPSFSIWLTDDDYDHFGEDLTRAYDSLPQTYQGITRTPLATGEERLRGPLRFSEFYRSHTGLSRPPATHAQWLAIPQSYLAECTNGKVFQDPLGLFTTWRNQLRAYYPEDVRRHKIAARCMTAGQVGQYNYPRHISRGDQIALTYMESRFSYDITALVFLLVKEYCPYYKWMYRGLKAIDGLGERVYQLLEKLHCNRQPTTKGEVIEEICRLLIYEISRQNIVGGNITLLMDLSMEIQQTIEDSQLRELFYRVDDAVLY